MKNGEGGKTEHLGNVRNACEIISTQSEGETPLPGNRDR